MSVDPVIERTRYARAVRRAYWAADERHARQEVTRLGVLQITAEDAELNAKPTTPDGARRKLWNVALAALLAGESQSGVLVRNIVRVLGGMRRDGLSVPHLADLRALVPLAKDVEAASGDTGIAASRIRHCVAGAAGGGLTCSRARGGRGVDSCPGGQNVR